MKKALQLREFREQLQLSQLEMAKFLRTTRSRIAMVERGGRSLQNVQLSAQSAVFRAGL